MRQYWMPIAFCAVLCLAGLSVRAAPAPEPLPTADELHKLYDNKDYQPLIQKLNRVLQLKGQAAQPYDRVDLLMLRGEALLQLKQQASAIEAFDAAAKEATAPKQDVIRKPEQVARARAIDLLVHHSPGLAYTPKHLDAGQVPGRISLLDPSQRDAAFKALLFDQLTEMAPKVKAASRGTTMGPIVQLIRSLGDLRAVEVTVTGKTKQSDEMLVTMADRAHALMDAEVDRLAPAEQTISRNAHQKTTHTLIQRDSQGTVVGQTSTITSRGLFSNDIRNLKEIASTCQQIASASHDFQDVTAGKQAAEFGALTTKAEKLAKDAEQTLSDDYTPQTNTNGALPTR
jgi:hypothetical protein